MNLWLRLIRVWLAARRDPILAPDLCSEIRVRAWPHDLDVWGHVNGGRYLTMSDLGRFDLLARLGVVKAARTEGWALPMGAAAVRFRRPWRLFRQCVLRTRVLGWDEKWGYMSTDFLRDGDLVATVVTRGTAVDRNGTAIPMGTILERVGWRGDPMPVPEQVRTWVTAGRSGEVGG
jgi:acyl-CoA thioesterase FadM